MTKSANKLLGRLGELLGDIDIAIYKVLKEISTTKATVMLRDGLTHVVRTENGSVFIDGINTQDLNINFVLDILEELEDSIDE